jgi:DNA-binding transcriptional MocR family regulator
MKASEIRELLKLLDQPDVISFAGGIPDPALFPAEAFGAALSSGAVGRQQGRGAAIFGERGLQAAYATGWSAAWPRSASSARPTTS